jgi:hypothetical protein
LVTVVGPRTHPVLYPRDETPKAVPKYLSGRTSYLRVRLAFHRYPQLIRAVFNRHRCGPPAAVRRPSPWPWVDHSVSGRRPATDRPVQTCFRCGCGAVPLNLATDRHSPVHSAKGTPSDPQELGVRSEELGPTTAKTSSSVSVPNSQLPSPNSQERPPTACRQPVSGSVSLPSRGAFHLSLTVLVHYRWQRVFSLRRWSSGIPPGLLVSRGTRGNSAKPPAFHLPGCHRLWPCFPAGSTRPAVSDFVGGLPPVPPPPRPRCRNAGRLGTAAV